MMKQRWFETLLGGVVLAAAIFFVSWAWNSSGNNDGSGIQRITANFQSIKGLRVGNDVRVGGVKIGTIERLGINPDTYQANVTMSITNSISLPDDSAIAIISDGLLGGAFMRVNPGQSATKLTDGSAFTRIEQSASLEELLGKAVFIISETSSQ